MHNALSEPLRASSIDERRRRMRHDVVCNALVRLTTALTFRCLLRNLSLDAAQIVCDARYALLVQPANTFAGAIRQHKLEISIALPANGTVRGLTTFCRPKYCERLQGDHMVLGLQFVDMEAGSRQLLDDFIAELEQNRHY